MILFHKLTQLKKFHLELIDKNICNFVLTKKLKNGIRIYRSKFSRTCY